MKTAIMVLVVFCISSVSATGHRGVQKNQERPQPIQTKAEQAACVNPPHESISTVEAHPKETENRPCDNEELKIQRAGLLVASKSEKHAFNTWQATENGVKVACYAFGVAIFVALIALYQVLMFRKQLAQMSGDSKVAEKAAIAASVSANTAQSALVNLERPYIFIKTSPTMATHAAGIGIGYVVANHGKIPAIISRIRATFSTTTNGIPIEPNAIEGIHELLDFPFLAPEEKRTTLSHAVGDAAGTVKNTEGTLYLWIIIDYDGPFTKGHRTSVCRYLNEGTNRMVPYGGDEYNYTK